MASNVEHRPVRGRVLPANLRASIDPPPTEVVMDLPRAPSEFKTQDILVAQNGSFPALLLAAAIPKYHDDVKVLFRLIVSAVINVSGVNASAFGISETGRVNSAEILTRAMTAAESRLPKEEESTAQKGKEKEEEADTVVVGHSEIKYGEAAWKDLLSIQVPEWVRDLDLTDEDLMKAAGPETAELAAFAGILLLTAVKTPNSQNLNGFNANRVRAIQSLVPNGRLEIFVPNSEYITLTHLSNAAVALNTHPADRACLIRALVDKNQELMIGPAVAFFRMFKLMEGSGLAPIRMCLSFILKYPEIVHVFPELYTEILTFSGAVSRFEAIEEKYRNFYKAMFGEKYVPVDRNRVQGLYGVAYFGSKLMDNRWDNYRGPDLNDEMRRRVTNLVGVAASAEPEVETAVREAE